MKAFHVSNLLTLMPNPVHAQNMHFKTKVIAKESALKKKKNEQLLLQFILNLCLSYPANMNFIYPIEFSVFAD